MIIPGSPVKKKWNVFHCNVFYINLSSVKDSCSYSDIFSIFTSKHLVIFFPSDPFQGFNANVLLFNVRLTWPERRYMAPTWYTSIDWVSKPSLFRCLKDVSMTTSKIDALKSEIHSRVKQLNLFLNAPYIIQQCH